jgi:hypothetical protein
MMYSILAKIAKIRNDSTLPPVHQPGLPDPQAMHAVISAQFAVSCIQSARDVTQSLVGTLGEDTADIQLRIGLNSGPVTLSCSAIVSWWRSSHNNCVFVNSDLIVLDSSW